MGSSYNDMNLIYNKVISNIASLDETIKILRKA